MLLDIGDIPLLRLYNIWNNLRKDMLSDTQLAMKSNLLTCSILKELDFVITPIDFSVFNAPKFRVAAISSKTVYTLYVTQYKVGTIYVDTNDGCTQMDMKDSNLYHSYNLELCTIYIDDLLDILKPYLKPEEKTIEFKQKLYDKAKEVFGEDYDTIVGLDKLYNQIEKLIKTDEKLKKLTEKGH
jgi:hypothetical protein